VEPARFVHSKEDAAALFRGFRTLYWAIVAVLAVGALWRPDLLLIAAVFAVVLLIWQRQVRGHTDREWVLEIDRDAVTVGTKRVRRHDASFVRFRRRTTRGAAWTELQVVGPSGKPVFREGIRDDHRDDIAAALRQRGWSVEADDAN
jgi:hypothetical protein